jgi:hypothetical protein
MSEIPTPNPAVPFLRQTEEQASKIRRLLEGIYSELDLVQDLLRVCSGACNAETADIREVDHVLRRCGSDRLFSIQKTLTSVIERFGGRTAMSKERQEAAQ